jgi:elongator complex protein 4
MLQIHRLPVFHEKVQVVEKLADLVMICCLRLRRKCLAIKPFSLPPVEGDSEPQQSALEHNHGKANKVDFKLNQKNFGG